MTIAKKRHAARVEPACPPWAADASLNRFSHPLDLTPGLSATIPKRWEGGGIVVLGSGGELVCRTCHLPHGAADKTYLLADHNQKDSLCVQCHSGQRGIASTSHYQKVISPGEENIKGQEASSLGPCSPCHLVHQGSDKLMWSRSVGKPAAQPGEICTGCHSPDGVAKEVMPASFSHPMHVKTSLPGSSLGLPLFDGMGKNMQGEVRCSTCHDFIALFPLCPTR